MIRGRWEFPQADLNRIYHLCTALFFGSWVLAFATGDGAGAITGLLQNTGFAARAEYLNKGVKSVLRVFQWLPLSFLPLMLTQAFGQRDRMDWATFSWWVRRQRGRGVAAAPESGLNVSWPYFALCLVAACSANERTLWFSGGLATLVAWALWTRRTPGSSALRWAACLLAALGLGVMLQFGLRAVQKVVQQLDNALVARLSGGRQFDPKESRTMIGSIGRVQQSGSIVLRVDTAVRGDVEHPVISTVFDGWATRYSSIESPSGLESAAGLGSPARTLSANGRSKNRFPGFRRRSGELSRNPSALSRRTIPATEAFDFSPTSAPILA